MPAEQVLQQEAYENALRQFNQIMEEFTAREEASAQELSALRSSMAAQHALPTNPEMMQASSQDLFPSFVPYLRYIKAIKEIYNRLHMNFQQEDAPLLLAFNRVSEPHRMKFVTLTESSKLFMSTLSVENFIHMCQLMIDRDVINTFEGFLDAAESFGIGPEHQSMEPVLQQVLSACPTLRDTHAKLLLCEELDANPFHYLQPTPKTPLENMYHHIDEVMQQDDTLKLLMMIHKHPFQIKDRAYLLHSAVRNNATDCTRICLNTGISVMTPDPISGQLPMHVAIEKEHLDCVYLLLRVGQKRNSEHLPEQFLVRDNAGNTPLMLIEKMQSDNKKHEVLKIIEREKEAFLEAHQTLLSDIASHCDNENLLQAFRDRNYNQALRKICAAQSLELFKIMRPYIILLNIDINDPSPSNGYTALDWLDKSLPEHSENKASLRQMLISMRAVSGSELIIAVAIPTPPPMSRSPLERPANTESPVNLAPSSLSNDMR